MNNRKIKLPNTTTTNNNKMKPNDKMPGKMKKKFLNKYLESQEIINDALRKGQIYLNRRMNNLLTKSADKDKQLEQAKDDCNQLKELMEWYDNGVIREQEKHDIFKRAYEMPYCENMNRLEFAKREIDKRKINEQNKLFVNSPRTPNTQQEWSQLTVSPAKSIHNNTLSPLKMIYPNLNLQFDKVSTRRIHDSESLNSSFRSMNNQSIHFRFNEWHKFIEKTLTNKTCNDCMGKLSQNNNKEVYKCKNCGFYIHDSCRKSNNRKLCIPLVKLPMKLTGDRTVELKDLCSTKMVPMVPSILLSLMHHIHTFGMETLELYRSTAKEKDVIGLCEKLIGGKPKFLSQYEINTVASCLRFVLRSLKSPLLSDYIMKKLIENVKSDSISSALEVCLNEMPQEIMETFVYLMIHLKNIADNENCGLNGKGLASIFAPSIISNEMGLYYLTASITVIEKLIDVNREFYIDYLPEKIFYPH